MWDWGTGPGTQSAKDIINVVDICQPSMAWDKRRAKHIIQHELAILSGCVMTADDKQLLVHKVPIVDSCIIEVFRINATDRYVLPLALYTYKLTATQALKLLATPSARQLYSCESRT